jgi:hypothetical protein
VGVRSVTVDLRSSQRAPSVPDAEGRTTWSVRGSSEGSVPYLAG